MYVKHWCLAQFHIAIRACVIFGWHLHLDDKHLTAVNHVGQ